MKTLKRISSAAASAAHKLARAGRNRDESARGRARARIDAVARAVTDLDPDWGQQLQAIAARAIRPMELAVVGEFSAGKSTFINALLEQEILPSGPLPTTGVITRIQHGSVSGLVLELDNGGRLNLALDALARFTSHTDAEDEQWLDMVNRVDVFVDSGAVQSLVILDTPGLNAPAVEDQEITNAVLEQADAILWVTSCEQLLSRTQKDTLEKFSDRYRSKSVCIISKTDTLRNPEHEIPALIKHARATIGVYFIDVVAVSALDALGGKHSEIGAVRTVLEEKVLPKRENWVAEMALLDARQRIRGWYDLVEEDSARPLEQLLAKYTGPTVQQSALALKKLRADLKKADRDYVQKLRALERKTAQTMRAGLETWKHYEPYTHTTERWFTDDHEVRYEEHRCWEFSEHSIETAAAQLWESWSTLHDEWMDVISDAIETADTRLKELHTVWRDTNTELCDALKLPDHLEGGGLDHGGIAGFMTLLAWGYWEGGMAHGGLAMSDLWLRSKYETTKPNLTAIKELMATCPIAAMVEYRRDQRKELASRLAAEHEEFQANIVDFVSGVLRSIRDDQKKLASLEQQLV